MTTQDPKPVPARVTLRFPHLKLVIEDVPLDVLRDNGFVPKLALESALDQRNALRSEIEGACKALRDLCQPADDDAPLSLAELVAAADLECTAEYERAEAAEAALESANRERGELLDFVKRNYRAFFSALREEQPNATLPNKLQRAGDMKRLIEWRGLLPVEPQAAADFIANGPDKVTPEGIAAMMGVTLGKVSPEVAALVEQIRAIGADEQPSPVSVDDGGYPVDLACSFCGKRRSELLKQFESRGHVICNECLVVCIRAGLGEPPPSKTPAAPAVVDMQALHAENAELKRALHETLIKLNTRHLEFDVLWHERERAKKESEDGAEALLDMLHLYSGYNVLSRGPIGCIHKALKVLHPEAQAMLAGGAEVDEVRQRFWPTDENGDPIDTDTETDPVNGQLVSARVGEGEGSVPSAAPHQVRVSLVDGRPAYVCADCGRDPHFGECKSPPTKIQELQRHVCDLILLSDKDDKIWIAVRAALRIISELLEEKP